MEKPNILLVNCDDMGYGDLSCYGSSVNRTPVLDRLAREGLAALEEHFRSHLKHKTRDFQTTHGYTRDLPGQANMTLACNSVGQKFDCLSLTLEMPFKDDDNHPDPRRCWSPGRSDSLGRALLDATLLMLPDLR